MFCSKSERNNIDSHMPLSPKCVKVVPRLLGQNKSFVLIAIVLILYSHDINRFFNMYNVV